MAFAGCVLLAVASGVALVFNLYTRGWFAGGAAQVQKKGKEAKAPDAKSQGRAPSPSRLPPDVVRDFGYNAAHLLNGAGAPLYAADERYSVFLSRLKEFPPEVLIVGKEAPFTHSLGPILSFGGENRTFPAVPNRKGEDPRRMLSPEELVMRIKATERFVSDAHAAGVRTVIPYISPMTAYGNAEKRLGFFQFFDAWDKYEKQFELGARPAGDPADWTQRDKEGKTYFRMGGGAEDLEGMTRYSMCVNNPGWRRWQTVVADWAARVGYDGLWMDNVLVHRCYCQYCQAVAKELGTDLSREPDRVWLESYSRYFKELRATGERRRGGFYLGGNYPELPYQRAVTDDLDLAMVEQVWLGAARILWPGGVWTGFYPAMPNQKVLGARTRGTSDERSLNNIWLARLAYAMRGGRGVHFLSGAPAGKGPEFAHNEDSAVVALAEGAAFGGGVAVQVTGQYPFNSDTDIAAHKARQRFFNFARSHRELYEGLLPAGDVAIVVFPDGDASALVEAEQVEESLLWRGILVDVLDGDKQSAATLSKYGLVVVPGRATLPEWMKPLPTLQSPDPLTPEEVRDVKKTFQRERGEAQIRQTKLAALVAERAANLRALTLPQDSLLEGAAWADAHRMVVHLLNFRTPIGLANGGKVAALTNVAVRLRLPKGKTARQVKIYSTDGADEKPITFKQQGDAVEFTVPSVRVYSVCEVTF
ncbi:MAG TPA: hypothetical protein VFA21_11075 [Pyrinomonadaceae bacterium]|nr:hypothetical protein [Pyrinomonadaceae bacterium]